MNSRLFLLDSIYDLFLMPWSSFVEIHIKLIRKTYSCIFRQKIKLIEHQKIDFHVQLISILLFLIENTSINTIPFSSCFHKYLWKCIKIWKIHWLTFNWVSLQTCFVSAQSTRLRYRHKYISTLFMFIKMAKIVMKDKIEVKFNTL